MLAGFRPPSVEGSSMISPLSTAVAGMQAASARLEDSARRVATGRMDDYAVEAVE